ncbi:MAG: DUF1963 domain-containing protein [Planctomycetes bacterium]|nr:DUF1963 domain-containing protein [Planctomycetota bacterium]
MGDALDDCLAALAPGPALARRLEDARRHLAPCLWLVPAAARTRTPAWAGGLPTLPPGTPWPEQDGRPLPYLIGVDLAALPAWLGLPATGTLHLFAAFSGLRALQVPAGAATAPMRAPAGPYLDDEPEPGEVHPRIPLRLVPGVVAVLPSERADPDGSLRDPLDRLTERVRPARAVARLGGPPDDPDEAASDGELAYLRRHGRESLWLEPRIQPGRLDARIARARAKPRPAAAPPPPAAPVDVLRRRAAAALGIAGTPRPLTAARTRLRDQLARLETGVPAERWIQAVELARRLMAWEDAVQALDAASARRLGNDPVLAAARAASNRRTARLAELERELTRGSLLKRMQGFIAQHQAAADAAADPAPAPLPAEANAACRILEERVMAVEGRRHPPTTRRALAALDRHLQAHAADLDLEVLHSAMEQRQRIAGNLFAQQVRQAGPTLDELLRRRRDLVWWHRDPGRHRRAIARQVHLLTLYESDHVYWGDAGHLGVWVDASERAQGRLSGARGVVSSA